MDFCAAICLWPISYEKNLDYGIEAMATVMTQLLLGIEKFPANESLEGLTRYFRNLLLIDCFVPYCNIRRHYCSNIR